MGNLGAGGGGVLCIELIHNTPSALKQQHEGKINAKHQKVGPCGLRANKNKRRHLHHSSVWARQMGSRSSHDGRPQRMYADRDPWAALVGVCAQSPVPWSGNRDHLRSARRPVRRYARSLRSPLARTQRKCGGRPMTLDQRFRRPSPKDVQTGRLRRKHGLSEPSARAVAALYYGGDSHG